MARVDQLFHQLCMSKYAREIWINEIMYTNNKRTRIKFMVEKLIPYSRYNSITWSHSWCFPKPVGWSSISYVINCLYNSTSFFVHDIIRGNFSRKKNIFRNELFNHAAYTFIVLQLILQVHRWFLLIVNDYPNKTIITLTRTFPALLQNYVNSTRIFVENSLFHKTFQEPVNSQPVKQSVAT